MTRIYTTEKNESRLEQILPIPQKGGADDEHVAASMPMDRDVAVLLRRCLDAHAQ
jgi:hypothetical protein